MPPWKGRRCRRLEGRRGFKPLGVPGHLLEREILALDEFEAMRLCDLEDHQQIEAAEKMGVSRATVQRLLNSGRKKLLRALLENRMLLLFEGEQDQKESEEDESEKNSLPQQ